jgi:hypothetical protein
VLKRLGHLLLILALLGATGTHWVMLQSVAWATMLADNARTGSLGEAVVKTFDGKHPCKLCRGIAQGRQSENKSLVQLELKKLEFVPQSLAFDVRAPRAFPLPFGPDATAPWFAHAPPVPPPRSLHG